MQCFRFTRFLAAGVLAIAVGSMTAAGSSPVSATGGSHGSESASFDITGYRCESEVTHEWVRPNGTKVVRTVQTGFTEASIALMTGALTVETTLVLRPGGDGWVRGRWTLEPTASTGMLRGTVRGSFTEPEVTELTSTGHGFRALRGIKISMTTTSPAAGTTDTCMSDLTFAGSGTASYREARDPVGAVVAESAKPFTDSVGDLAAAIDANPNLVLAKTVDHQAAAASRGLVLPPTTELFFGNAAIGTPLMQSAQTAGIDLPVKILVWEDLFGVVRVSYNASSYLQSRHRIEGADAQLNTLGNALAGLASVATGTTVDPVFDAGTVRRGAGLVTIETDRSADDAFAAIVAALEAAPPVNVAFVAEHDVAAATVPLELRPTKLVVFGNPSLGTVLMQTDQSIALDLPQKILVHTDADGQTFITYNDPHFVAQRHGVRGQDELLDTLSGALANFARAGT